MVLNKLSNKIWLKFADCMLKTDRFRRIFIFILALISAGSVHLLNRHHIGIVHSEALRYGISVHTADDASYLSPPERFLQTGSGGTAVRVSLAGYSAALGKDLYT